MRSEGQPIRPFDEMLWMADIPGHWARERPQRVAVGMPELGIETTYAQLDAYTHRFVGLLQERGYRPGDRIAYLGRNSDLYFPVFFGVIVGGFVLVPINWRCAAPEITMMLDDAGVNLVIVDDDFAPLLTSALDADASLRRVAVLRTEGKDSLRALLNVPSSVRFAIPHERDQVCVQMYTSGTTGRPKGVLCTHGAFTAAREAELVSEDWASWNERDVILSPLPNFHMGGMSWMLIGLVRGLTCVLTVAADIPKLLELAGTHDVTRIFIVPTLVQQILEHLRTTGAPPPRIRTITYGAAVMSESLLREALDVLKCEFGQYFGMTEATGTVTFLSPKDHDVSRPHLLKSVGRAQCGMAVEIRDPDNRILPARQSGEIWVRTPTLLAGYWKLPEATAAAVQDGWYRTGDGGYLDEEGYLYLTDRIRDMIISGGENVYPAQVEEVLSKHPAVQAVAVVGVPHPRWGESIVAIVERRAGAVVSEEELIAFSRQHLARFKCPRVVRFAAVLPRTALGKIQRALLRAEAARDTELPS